MCSARHGGTWICEDNIKDENDEGIKDNTDNSKENDNINVDKEED